MEIDVTSLRLADGNDRYTVQFQLKESRKAVVEFQGSAPMHQEDAIVEQALGVLAEILEAQKPDQDRL